MVITSPYRRVPVSEELLHEKVLRAIRKHAKTVPNKPALVQADDPRELLTYADIDEHSQSAASYMSKLGVGAGDVVCMVLSNCLEYAPAYLAILSCGAAMSPASAMFTEFELETQFRDSKSKLIITDGPYLDKVWKAASKFSGTQVICIRCPKDLKRPGVHSWEDIIEGNRKNLEYVKSSAISEDLALLPYSSGTTGSPKGVMLSHKNFGTVVDVFEAHFQDLANSKLSGPTNWYKQNLLLVLPFYHGYGFTCLHFALITGATGVVFSKFQPQLFLQNIQKFKVEILMVVPPLLLFLAKSPDVLKYDLSHVKIVKVRSAPIGQEVVDEFAHRLPNVKYVEQVYGLTECGMAFHRPMFDSTEKNPVGHPSPSFMIKIVDPATGKEVENGSRGEICLKSPTIMKGYFNRPQATAETLDNSGWMKTGDIGYIDARGQTYVVDRIKELIKVKGLQVPPAELEDLLLGHPGIADVVVIGIPDERSGEKPKAFVVKKDEKLTARQVQQYVEGKVASYKWLTGGVEFISQIPKSPSGKILRRLLRDKQKAKL